MLRISGISTDTMKRSLDGTSSSSSFNPPLSRDLKWSRNCSQFANIYGDFTTSTLCWIYSLQFPYAFKITSLLAWKWLSGIEGLTMFLKDSSCYTEVISNSRMRGNKFRNQACPVFRVSCCGASEWRVFTVRRKCWNDLRSKGWWISTQSGIFAERLKCWKTTKERTISSTGSGCYMSSLKMTTTGNWANFVWTSRATNTRQKSHSICSNRPVLVSTLELLISSIYQNYYTNFFMFSPWILRIWS